MYIRQNDLSGKRVALFFTLDHEPKEAVERTKALIPNSTVVGELVLPKPMEKKEETKKKIIDWCNTLKL